MRPPARNYHTLAFVMMLVNKDRRTLYDHISGIVLLQDPNKVLAPPK